VASDKTFVAIQVVVEIITVAFHLIEFKFMLYHLRLQCFDADGWATGRAFGR